MKLKSLVRKQKPAKLLEFGKPNGYSASAVLGDENNFHHIEAKDFYDLPEMAKKVQRSWGNVKVTGIFKNIRKHYLVEVTLIVNNQKVDFKASHLTYLYSFLRKNNVTRVLYNSSTFNHDYFFRVDDLLIMRGLKERDPKRNRDWF